MYHRETNIIYPDDRDPELMDFHIYRPHPVPAHELDMHELVQRGPFEGVMAKRVQKGMRTAYDNNTKRLLKSNDPIDNIRMGNRLGVDRTVRAEMITQAMRELIPPARLARAHGRETMMQPSLQ